VAQLLLFALERQELVYSRVGRVHATHRIPHIFIYGSGQGFLVNAHARQCYGIDIP
jgi:hypothetical protein